MRSLAGLLLGIVVVVLVTPGCGPSLSEDDLGTVIYGAMNLPGADQPYVLPDEPAESTPDPEVRPADDA
jgi:hypothetical protein